MKQSFLKRIVLISIKSCFIFVISFLIFVSIVGFINYKLGIHQRGFLYHIEIPSIIVNLTKWLLLFGFTTFSCFLIHVEIKNQKKINIFTIIIALLEVCVSYTSMLSRSFIINAASLILPTYQQSLKLINNSLKRWTLSNVLYSS